MYLPAATVAAVMAMENTIEEDAFALRPVVTSTTASSIYIKWDAWEGGQPKGFEVQYNRIASSYFQYSGLLAPSTTTYGIKNLVADTYYKVCVKMCLNESYSIEECLETNTNSWPIPVSIGSSIGAVLALSIIVLIVLLSRCPNLVRQPRTAAAESSKYDSMSSHFPDDRYEMSDTTTHCHDRDDDVFSQNSEGDSLGDSKGSARPNHYSPQSLADRVCNGNKIINGLGKPARANIPLGRCGRTLSLTEKRHVPGHPHRTRQARLAHMHTHFHSIQSEPGSYPVRAAPRISISDLPASTHGSDFASSRNHQHHSSMPSTNVPNGKGSLAQGSGSHGKVSSAKDTPRLISKMDSATSASDPTVAEGTASRMRPPVLKYLSKTLHMSIDGDTLV